MEHTPGPWERKGMRGLDVWGNGHTLARTGTLALPEDELQANARLIAASPALLSALERITAHMEVMAQDEGELIVIDQARAAILAAKGEA